MFMPKSFDIKDDLKIFSFINENSFGQLISTVEGRIFSTHIPFLLSDDKKSLFAHIAKQNPQHLDIQNQEVLITLNGPHDYISPSWYKKSGVPTWNYQTVHIYGTCEIFSNTDALKDIVDSLTSRYESKFKNPWIPNYKASMLSAIIGLKINITDIQCKFKLSQNKSIEDQKEVALQLKSLGSVALSSAMSKNIL